MACGEECLATQLVPSKEENERTKTTVPANQVRLFFSYSPDKTSFYFKTLRNKLEYKTFFKSFDIARIDDSVFSLPQFSSELAQITDSIIPLDHGKHLLLQYQRPDLSHQKRYVLLDSLYQEETGLSYRFMKPLEDAGLPSWHRYRVGEGIPTDVITTPKALFICNTGDLSNFKRIPLTDQETRNKMSPKDNPHPHIKEDIRYPTQPQVGYNWFLYLAEKSGVLVGVNAKTYELAVIASEVESFNLYLDYLVVVSDSPDHLQIIHYPETDVGKNRIIVMNKILDTYSKNVTERLRTVKDRKVVMKAPFIIFTGESGSVSANVILLSVGLPRITSLYCGNNRKFKCDMNLDFQSLIHHESSSSSINKVEVLVVNLSVTLIIAIEAVFMHILFYLPMSHKFGNLKTNLMATSSKDSEIYGHLMLPGNRLLLYGYYVHRIYQIKMKVKDSVF